ncbi:MAG TPA: alpha/beta hydrolase [Solirubrobacterales bacterium]|nr:alpha/beta hydrolase [Solirubrobacterales bacterium]
MPGDLSLSVQKHAIAIGARLLFGLPDRLLAGIFGTPPDVARGLRPDAWALSRVSDLIEGSAAVDPVAMRAETENLAWAASDRTTLPVEVTNLDIGDAGAPLGARLYRPRGVSEDGPLLVYFHGGGWVVGSLDSHDFSCRRLAHAAEVRVLAVEYRLAPEHPFPAAPDDALRAWRAVTADPGRFGADPERIAVGGDSAGGNLAAVLCQDLRAADLSSPLFQLLIYPVAEIGSDWGSYREFETGFYLTRERMDWYEERYAPGGAGADVRASPLKAEDLSGLPRAYVITSLADPLRDEGEAYARRLIEAGVETRLDRFPLVHAWFNQTVSRSSRTAHRILADRIRELFGI